MQQFQPKKCYFWTGTNQDEQQKRGSTKKNGKSIATFPVQRAIFIIFIFLLFLYCSKTS
jgi:hypothetical protein